MLSGLAVMNNVVTRAEEARRWVAKTNTLGIPNPNFRQWSPWAEEPWWCNFSYVKKTFLAYHVI